MAALDPLFRPRAVAVIGASRDRRTVGGSILHNLLSFEFQGQVFAVNPRAAVVHSLKSYPTVEAIPDPVDLAVIAVPRPLVLDAVESCGRKGVGAVVIITAGFKETGRPAWPRARGRRPRPTLRHPARRAQPHGRHQHGSGRPTAGLFGQRPRPATSPSSQSGALGEAILACSASAAWGCRCSSRSGTRPMSRQRPAGILEHDRRRGSSSYLESFGNPQRFLEICQRVSKQKPVVAVKSGRTMAGARAAASHTGSLAGADTAVESLFAQSGVLRATSIEELFVFASALASQPIPRGTRVAIVTNSGGPAILATDACIDLGLEIPTLAPETQARIRAAVAPEASVANPVDMIATATGPQYEVAVRAAADDPEVDAIIAIFTSLEMIDGPSVAQGIVRGAEGCGKPVLVCFMGSLRSREAVDLMRRAGLAVYTFPEDAARALAAMVRYGRWRARPLGTRRRFDDLDHAGIDEVVAAVRASGRQQLTLAEAQRVLDLAKVPVLAWREAGSADEAATAAAALGFPVVVRSVRRSSSTSRTSAGCASAWSTKPAWRRRREAAGRRPGRRRPGHPRRAAAGVGRHRGDPRRDARPKFGPC